MTYEITPEPGEKFALVGEGEVLLKGLGHQIRKGHIIVTDRRIAFKGRLAIVNVVHLAAHAVGAGHVDMSIPYENIKSVQKSSTITTFHIDVIFLDPTKGKDETLRIKLDRWGKAMVAVHVADLGIHGAHAAEIASREINFVPIAGDFISIGLKIAHWKAGRDASDTWIETIKLAINEKGRRKQVRQTEKKHMDKSLHKFFCPYCKKIIQTEWLACPYCGRDL
jgi:hypothetical protein